MTREEMSARNRKYYVKHRERRLAAKRAYYLLVKDDPEFKRKNRERAARNYARMTNEQRARANALRRARKLSTEARARKNLLRKEARAKQRGERTVREIVRAERTAPKPIPTLVRDAWKQSDSNSILQKKYPSYAHLRRGAARGDFDHISEAA
jgi:hypothetical protein